MTSSLNQTGLTSPSVDADEYTIGGSPITGITHDPSVSSYTTLSSSVALATAIGQVMAVIDENLALTPFTDSIVSSEFVSSTIDPDKGWQLYGWDVTVGRAKITQSGFNVDNFLRIPQGRYPENGVYFLLIEVPEIDGVLTVYQNSTIIGEVTSPGKHGFRVIVSNRFSADVYIKATSISTGQAIEVENPYLVGVDKTLDDYVVSVIDNRAAELQFVTQQEVDASIAAHVAQTDPHPQYFPRDDGRSMVVANRVFPATQAYKPVKPWNPAPILVRSSRLMHDVPGPYDDASGYIVSNKQPINTIGTAVNVTLTAVTRKARFDRSALVTLTYTFHESRSFTGIELYLDDVGLASVNSVRIIAGSVDTQPDVATGITGGHRTVTVNFGTTTTTDTLTIVVQGINNTGSEYAIGFDVLFSDASGSNVVVKGQLHGVAGSPSGPVTVKVVNPITIPVGSMVQGHPYELQLISTTPTSHAAVLAAIPTVYANDGVCAYPLQDRLGNDAVYYGSCAVTGDYTGNGWLLYKDQSDDPIETEGLTLTQTLVVPSVLHSISIRLLDVSVLAGLSLTLTLDTNAVHTFDQDDFVTKSLPSEDVMAMSVPSGLGNVRTIALTLAAEDDEVIDIVQINVGFTTQYFDTTQKKWSDAYTRTVLGRLTWYGGSRYGFDPVSYNGSISMAVEGLNTLIFGSSYTCPNPYGHTDVVLETSAPLISCHITPGAITLVPCSDQPVYLTGRSFV